LGLFAHELRPLTTDIPPTSLITTFPTKESDPRLDVEHHSLFFEKPVQATARLSASDELLSGLGPHRMACFTKGRQRSAGPGTRPCREHGRPRRTTGLSTDQRAHAGNLKREGEASTWHLQRQKLEHRDLGENNCRAGEIQALHSPVCRLTSVPPTRPLSQERRSTALKVGVTRRLIEAAVLQAGRGCHSRMAGPFRKGREWTPGGGGQSGVGRGSGNIVAHPTTELAPCPEERWLPDEGPVGRG